MVEQTAYGITFGEILEAGVIYSFNPAVVLGGVLFLFFLFRANKVYGAGVRWPSLIFLPVFFAVQAMIHLGVFDFLFLYVPGALGIWDILRGIGALAAIVLGIMMGVSFLKRSVNNSVDIFKKILYFKLDTHIFFGKSHWYKRYLMVIKSALWATVFAFFCGTWPLHRWMLCLMYDKSFNLAERFLGKFLVFELLTMTPFFLATIAGALFIEQNNRLRNMLQTRFALAFFSITCVGVGLSMLIYYFREFFII